MAVEMWVTRDHEAEWKRWTGWLDHIAQAPVVGRRCDDDRHSAQRLVQSHAVAENPVGSAKVRPDRRRRGPRAARGRAAHRDGRGRRRATADGRVGHAVHDGGRRRADRRRPPARAAVEAARRSRATPSPAAAGRRSRRSVERQHPVRGGEVDAYAPPDSARQRPRRLSSGRLHDPRHHGHHRRRHRAHPKRLRRAARRLGQPHVLRQGRWRRRCRARSTWANISARRGRATRRGGAERVDARAADRRARSCLALASSCGQGTVTRRAPRPRRSQTQIRSAASRRPRHRSARTRSARCATSRSPAGRSRPSRRRSESRGRAEDGRCLPGCTSRPA